MLLDDNESFLKFLFAKNLAFFLNWIISSALALLFIKFGGERFLSSSKYKFRHFLISTPLLSYSICAIFFLLGFR